MRATVEMFLPDKAFGFCETAEAGRFYFHVEAFDRGLMGGPPPVLGEEVEIEGVKPCEGRCPKARIVRRLQEPAKQRGLVRSFDPNAGWGFVAMTDGSVCFLHTSDFVAPSVVSMGMAVDFYVGHRRGRPRACYVTVE
jgi:cold shock CspA family protein